MRYLIFDIECCDGKHICEFGYVIANENFEIQEKKVFLINPEYPFNLKDRPGQDDLELYFSEEEYYSSPIFPHRYEVIKELIEHEDQIVIGHSISNDIGFLSTACKKYKLAPINFSFLDSQRVYSEFFNNKSRVSLANAEVTLELSKPEYLHKSDDDAKLTMELVQSVCRQLEATLTELMDLCPTACGKSENFHYQYTGSSLKEMLEIIEKNPDLLSNNKKERCLRKFIEKVSPQGRVRKHSLNGSTICFSKSIEKQRIRDVMVLIQLLANIGCQYSTKISGCNYYVAADEELLQTEIDVHTRYYAAVSGESGEHVTLLTWDDFLKMLAVTEKELCEMEMPTINSKEKRQRNTVYYSSGETRSTLGDQLKAKGIDLQALIK
jgi:DNA polymerase III epsilon subunit-like protein